MGDRTLSRILQWSLRSHFVMYITMDGVLDEDWSHFVVYFTMSRMLAIQWMGCWRKSQITFCAVVYNDLGVGRRRRSHSVLYFTMIGLLDETWNHTLSRIEQWMQCWTTSEITFCLVFYNEQGEVWYNVFCCILVMNGVMDKNRAHNLCCIF